MKQFRCEMCGSTELIKQDGLFVCQACGCKYTVEEAKKLMVEIEGKVDVSGSTVRVDSSEKLNNLLLLAKRARDEKNADEAKRYYEMALIEDPTNWESAFYSQYYSLKGSTIGDLQKNLGRFYQRSMTTLDMIVKDEATANEKIQDMIRSVTVISYELCIYVYQTMQTKIDTFIADMIEDSSNSMKSSFYSSRSKYIEKQFDNDKESLFNITKTIRISLGGLYVKAIGYVDVLGKDTVLNIATVADSIYMSDINYIHNMTEYEEFTRDLIQLLFAVQIENPDFESKAMPKLRERASYYLSGGKNSAEAKQKYGTILDIIANEFDKVKKERDEKKRKEALEQYWESHKEEKEALENEKKALETEKDQISEIIADLKNKKKNLPEAAEYDATQKEIEKKTIVKNSLGIFKGKEKKTLESEIKTLRDKAYQIKDACEVKKKAIDDEIKPQKEKMFQIVERIRAITSELTKDR